MKLGLIVLLVASVHGSNLSWKSVVSDIDKLDGKIMTLERQISGYETEILRLRDELGVFDQRVDVFKRIQKDLLSRPTGKKSTSNIHSKMNKLYREVVKYQTDKKNLSADELFDFVIQRTIDFEEPKKAHSIFTNFIESDIDERDEFKSSMVNMLSAKEAMRPQIDLLKRQMVPALANARFDLNQRMIYLRRLMEKSPIAELKKELEITKRHHNKVHRRLIDLTNKHVSQIKPVDDD